MKHLSILCVAALPVLFLATGCVADAGDTGEAADPALRTEATGREHLMRTTQALAEAEGLSDEAGRARGSRIKLTYYGGPVIQNVNVIPVYWTSNVQYQSNLNAFYAAVSTGSYMSFLSQYDTTSPHQTIGNGARGTPYVDDDTATNVTDAEVQAELNRLFVSGSPPLPAPNANNLYMVHFPPGVTITDSSGNQSCVVFCAYHGTYTRNGQDVFYGIIPDQGGGCAGGCGGNPQRVNNLTSVSSHEFAESITDPAIGLATVYGPPLAWYSANGGEIGDICNAQQAQVTLGGSPYTVQKLWSNQAGACVAP